MNKLYKRKVIIIAFFIIGVIVILNCFNIILDKENTTSTVVKTNKEKDEQGKEESTNKDNNNEKDKKVEDDSNIKGNISAKGLKDGISGDIVEKYLSGSLEDEKKYVFLTFDDGPSEEITPKILETLNNEKVKATFFVLGKEIDATDNKKKILKREYDEGHAIGNHTYSHDYKSIYPNNSVNPQKFLNDIDKANETIKSVVGEKFESNIVRMPGGEMSRRHYKDPNLKILKDEFAKRNIYSIDWNCLNGDAESKPYNKEQMLQYVKNTSTGKNKVVVLMHDSQGKYKTSDVLPDIIKYFKQEGYEFKTIKS